MLYRSEINSRNYCIIVGYICEYGCMGQTWPFLLMYESHEMRHTGFPQVDGGQRDPGFWDVTSWLRT